MTSGLTTPPPTNARKRVSLRFVLATGLGGLLTVLLAMSLVVQFLLYDLAEQRRAARTHYVELREHVEARMISQLDQEVCLRGYISTGDPQFLEPYERGKRSDSIAQFSIARALTDADRTAMSAELTALETAIDAWHSDVAEAQLTARRIGPTSDLAQVLRTDEQSFEDLRAAHAALSQALLARSGNVIARMDDGLNETNRLALAATFAVFLAASLLIRYLLKHSVDPITALADRAASNQPLEAPDERERVAELHRLSASLFALDSAARERERVAQKAHAQAEALGGFGEFVQQLADDVELHGALARTLHERVAPTKLHILVRNTSHNRLDIAWPEGQLDEPFKHSILTEPVKCRAVRTMQPVTSSTGASTCCKCSLGVPETGSYHCVPMLAAGELVGLVNIQAEDRASFDPELQHLSQSYISFASTTLSSIRLLAATRARALRDPLTQAYNRGFLSEYLAKQLSQASRRGSQVSVLMLDVDHFKRLNDTYGHQVGDRALVSLASCLHEQVRVADAVIRYGGEEFVILLSDADSITAMAIAERIRVAVERQVVSHEGRTIGNVLRCSIGAATYPTHGNDEAALLSAADRALYRAKANGRNNVVLTSDDLPRT